MAGDDPEFAQWLATRPKEDRQPEPQIEPHVAYLWQAWGDLKSDRLADGFGNIGPIHYSTISAYARDHDITGQDFLIFKTLLKAMDEEYLIFKIHQRENPTE